MAKNKERKKVGRELRQIEENEVQKLKQKPLYDEFKECKEKISQETKTKQYAETYISSQIQGMYRILQTKYFIDEHHQPTQKGLNACYLHEIPCLTFCDFYESFDTLSHYTEVQILCLLSCFYDVKVKDDFKTHTPPMLVDELAYIHESMQAYTHEESKQYLYITCQHHLQYDMMEYIQQWYETVHNETDSSLFFETIIFRMLEHNLVFRSHRHFFPSDTAEDQFFPLNTFRPNLLYIIKS